MRKLSLLLLLCMCGACIMSAADISQTIDGITYSLVSATNSATVMNTPSGSVSIPASVRYNNRTYNVTTISAVNSGVTSIEIAEGVSSIGVAFSRGLTSLTSVILPSTIQRIEDGAFYNSSYSSCSSLISINLPEGLTYIGANAFKECTSLPEITIPSTLTSMGNNAFDGCTNLKKITWNAKHCVDFASGSVAPFNTEYKEYKGNGQGYSYYRQNRYTNTFTIGEEVEYIPAYLCYNLFSLSSIVFPNSVKEIGEGAFYGYFYAYPLTGYDATLTNITFGNGLERIGAQAFYFRTGLTSITIPDNCTKIGRSAFGSCDNLSTITIGKNINTISAYAFAARYNNLNTAQRYETNINTINIYANTPPVIAANVFNNYDDLMAITLNVRSTALASYQNATIWKDMYIQALENDFRTYTLSVSSEDESKGITTTGGAFDEDTEVLIYAAAKDGYRFSQWSDGNTENPRTIAMTGNLTYVAQFIPNLPTYTLTISSTNEAQGLVLGGGIFEAGTFVTIAAIAKSGYTFSQWNDGNTENPRMVQLTGDVMFFANFVQAAVETPKYTLTVMPTNNTQGTTFGSGEYENGTSLLIAAFANEGYHFTQWNDGNTDNPRIITTGSSSSFYFANFAQETVAPTLYELNVTPENEAQGWTTEGCTYELGAQVMIYAQPIEGFVFSKWSDGITDNPRFVTINGPIELKAQFEVQTVANINTAEMEPDSLQKILRDGQIFIIRGDKIYTLTGQEVK